MNGEGDAKAGIAVGLADCAVGKEEPGGSWDGSRDGLVVWSKVDIRVGAGLDVSAGAGDRREAGGAELGLTV